MLTEQQIYEILAAATVYVEGFENEISKMIEELECLI